MICYNGQYQEEFLFNVNNRAFRYGDGFFESARVIDGKIPLWHLHEERLKHSINYLGLGDELMQIDYQSQLLELLKRKGLSNARCKMSFFREGEGFYAPTSTKGAYLLEAWPFDGPLWKDGNEPLNIGVYTENKKAMGPLSQIKSISAILPVMAARWVHAVGLQEAIILNQEGNLCEAVSCNFFLIKDAKVYTPSFKDGPVDGVMRRYIIETLLEHGKPVIEKSLTEEDLFYADEVFLTSAIRGIIPVGRMGVKEYKREHTCSTVNSIFP